MLNYIIFYYPDEKYKILNYKNTLYQQLNHHQIK